MPSGVVHASAAGAVVSADAPVEARATWVKSGIWLMDGLDSYFAAKA
jgi:hypothetical protein